MPGGVSGRRRVPDIAIGRLRRPHGVHGEIKFEPYFDDDVIALFSGAQVTLAPEGGASHFTARLLSVRPGGKLLIAAFEGIASPEDARKLTHCEALVPRERMPNLPEGRYYFEEIVGLPVFSPEGERLGALAGFFPAGEKDVWEIRTDRGGEILLPALPETVLKVDLDEGMIVVRLMEEVE